MWVAVKKAQGLVEANIIKSLLEAHGIPVELRYETAAALFGLTLDGLGEVEILVPENYVGYAKSVISKAEEKDGLDT